ncbi:MAG: DUF4040 domain-containing protein [Spirochaetales bacterium]|nr:DUF4040 domain-containing protein [Spirochaetales bacterium]
MMIYFSMLVLFILMNVTALMMIKEKSLFSAVAALSFIGLLASVVFFLLGAPDVALTEAAMGSGLTSLVFVVAIRNTRSQVEDINE